MKNLVKVFGIVILFAVSPLGLEAQAVLKDGASTSGTIARDLRPVYFSYTPARDGYLTVTTKPETFLPTVHDPNGPGQGGSEVKPTANGYPVTKGRSYNISVQAFARKSGKFTITATIAPPTPVKSMEQAALMVHEGDYYLKRFEQWSSLAPQAPTLQASTSQRDSGLFISPTKGSQGPEISVYIPFYVTDSQLLPEKDIDKAITNYEEALKLQPKGTWEFPKNHSGQIYIETNEGTTEISALAPTGGIQAKLENAKKIQQEWQSRQTSTTSTSSIREQVLSGAGLRGSYEYRGSSISFAGYNFMGTLNDYDGMRGRITGRCSILNSKLTLSITSLPVSRTNVFDDGDRSATWNWTIVDENTLVDENGNSWKKETQAQQ